MDYIKATVRWMYIKYIIDTHYLHTARYSNCLMPIYFINSSNTNNFNYIHVVKFYIFLKYLWNGYGGII